MLREIRCSDYPVGDLRCGGAAAELRLEDIEAADGKPAAKKFGMVAYTGAMMRIEGWWRPVVVDIAGMEIPRQTVPVDLDHQTIVGHTTKIEKSEGNQRIYASGILSGYHASEQDAEAAAARKIVRLSQGGFEWQASITASPDKVEFLDKGEKATVNGRVVVGPAYIAKQSTLKAIAITAIGADGNTSTSIAASQGKGIPDMNFEQWLKAKGFDALNLSKDQMATLQAAYDKDHPAPAPTPAPPADPTTEIRAKATQEITRINRIRDIAAKHPGATMEIDDQANPGKKKRVDIEAHAIENGLAETETELCFLRNVRAQAPFGYVASSRPAPTNEVIQAAICMTRGLPNVEKEFKPEILEAAHRHYRQIGLQQVILMAAAQNGYHCEPGTRITASNLREVLRHAMAPEIRAGFSTVSLPGILGAVANKELVAGYMQEDMTWRDIAAVRSVSNFHTVTSYRLLDNMAYEELGPNGEIKHGTVGQESYTRQAKTYAKMFALTRANIINDDLGAFDDLRARLGRGAATKFNDIFWAAWMANSSFFTSGNTNYISGATTNLGLDGVGLGLGVKAFRQMTTPTADGAKRIGGRPEILLVPPELESIAETLYRNTNLGSGTANSNANIYANKYRPVIQVRLSDSSFTGYSTTAWYLLNNPGMRAGIVVSFLNGMETPTVESAEADFDTLGIQFRGYHDWGCDLAEYLAGIKSKGAA